MTAGERSAVATSTIPGPGGRSAGSGRIGIQERHRTERERRALLASVGGALAKAVQTGVALVSVRLTLGYLGFERYGLLMTVTSVTAFLSFADFGMGNGLLTAISTAHGRDDREAAKRNVSSIFYMLLTIALVCLVSLALAYRFIPWMQIYNVRSPLAVAEAGPATVVFVLCTLLCLPLGVVQRVQSGYQEGFRAAMWQAGASLISLIALLVTIACKAGLVPIVLAVSGAQVLVGLLNSLHEFGWSRPWLAPTSAAFCWRTSKKLAHTGFQFFLLQLVSIVGFSSDYIVLAHCVGAGSVAQYATVQKLFLLISTLQGVVLTPLWPAYAEAAVRGDYAWIKRTLFRSTAVAMALAGTLSLPLILYSGPLLWIWTKQAVAVPPQTLWGLATWRVLYGYGASLWMFLSALNRLRVLLITGTLFAVVSVGAKLLLAHRWESAGVIWATVITYAAIVVVPVGMHERHVLSSLRHNT